MRVDQLLDAYIISMDKIFYVGMTTSIAKSDSTFWTWTYDVGYINVASYSIYYICDNADLSFSGSFSYTSFSTLSPMETVMTVTK